MKKKKIVCQIVPEKTMHRAVASPSTQWTMLTAWKHKSKNTNGQSTNKSKWKQDDTVPLARRERVMLYATTGRGRRDYMINKGECYHSSTVKLVNAVLIAPFLPSSLSSPAVVAVRVCIRLKISTLASPRLPLFLLLLGILTTLVGYVFFVVALLFASVSTFWPSCARRS